MLKYDENCDPIVMCLRLAAARGREVRAQKAARLAAEQQPDEVQTVAGDTSSDGKSRSQNDRA
jgi:hypothetical protein